MPGDILILLEGFNGGEVFRQRFFVVETMNPIVTDSADKDALLAFGPGKLFPGFFPAVELPGDEVVAGQKSHLPAKLALMPVGITAAHRGNLDSSQPQNRFWASVLSLRS